MKPMTVRRKFRKLKERKKQVKRETVRQLERTDFYQMTATNVNGVDFNLKGERK